MLNILTAEALQNWVKAREAEIAAGTLVLAEGETLLDVLWREWKSEDAIREEQWHRVHWLECEHDWRARVRRRRKPAS